MAFNTHDQVPDSPTNTFATWNPLDKARDNTVLSDGNLASTDTSSGYATNYANIVVPETGLYYVEFTVKTFGSSNAVGIYVGNNRTWANIYGSTGYPYDTNTFMLMHNGLIYYNGNTHSYHPTFAAGDVVALIIDGSTRNVWLRKNNSLISGDNYTTGSQSGGVVGALSGISALPDGDMYVFTMASGSASPSYSNSTIVMNAGQDHTFGGYPNSLASSSGYSDANGIGSFYYSPPTGALSLNTKNIQSSLAIDPADDDLPEDHFKAVIWTNATTDTNVTVNLPFQADMIWWKQRNVNNGHRLIDSVRGLTSELSTNANFEESIIDPTTRDYNVTAINADNFTFNGYINTNTRGGTMVGWCFRAGGAPSGATSATGSAKRINSSGTQDDTSCSALASAASATITPTLMSINQKAGFSIVKWQASNNTSLSNPSIPHGLSQTPDFIIIKSLDSTQNWMVWHTKFSNSAANYSVLNDASTLSTAGINVWGNSGPSNNLINFTPNSAGGSTNYSNDNHIAYCWHSVAGYSKCGSYEGNGSTDGPYIECGFRVGWLLLKNIDLAGDWWLMDTTRDTHNVAEKVLYPNLAGPEYVGASVFGRDFLSNGFKVRNNNFGVNGNGNRYIYAAFAEMPFKYANAR